MKKYFKYILIFIFIIFVSAFTTIFNNDEIWNYGFMISIYKGLMPYRDFNMVITPLYPILMSLPFHIFGYNEIVVLITNAIILTSMFILLDKLISDKKYIVLLLMVFPLPIVLPSYNNFLFVLLVILLYCEEHKKSDWLIGLLIGLLFLTKQTVGGCILLVGLLFYIKDYKKVLKRLVGFLIPVFILFIYLIVNNAFYDFIDYCFLGLIDFGDKNTIIHINTLIMTIVLFVNVFYCIIKNPKKILNYYILVFYSIILPLMDLYHIQVALLACVILNIYNFKITDKYVKYIKLFCILTALGSSLVIFISTIPTYYPNDINHFEYRLIPKANVEFTKEVNEYRKKHKDREIFYLSADAYYFRIINDEKITKLDLINNGNQGYNGSDKIIKEINKHKDALFMIYEADFAKDSQIDKKTLYYIKKNCIKVDSIGIYDVYEFNKDR